MVCYRVKTALLPPLFSLAMFALSGCGTPSAVTASQETQAKTNEVVAKDPAEVQAHGLAWNLARLALTEKTLNATVRESVVVRAVDTKTFEPTNPGTDMSLAAPTLLDRMLGNALEAPQWIIVTPVDAKPVASSLGCSVAVERFATEFLEAAKKTAQSDGLWVPVHEWGRWHETLYIYLQVKKSGGIGQAPELLDWKLSLPCGNAGLPQMTREELLTHVPGLDQEGLPAGETFSVIGLAVGEDGEARESFITRSLTYSATSHGRTQEAFLSKFLPSMGRNLPEGVFMITPGVLEAGHMTTKYVAVPFVATKDRIVPFVRKVSIESR